MFSVTSEQIKRFRNDGFLVVDRIIEDAQIDILYECFEKMFRGEFETGIRPDEVNWQEGTGDPTLTRQLCNGWKADRNIADVVLREDLGKAISELGGWPGARIMVDNLLWKPPGSRSLAHHQDCAFLSWY